MKNTQQRKGKKAQTAKKGKGIRGSLSNKPLRRPQRRLQLAAPVRSAVSHPYLACLAGSPSMNPMGVGFPDGNPNKSIVIDFKQIVTLTPNGGSIRFALVSSPYGCIAVSRGVITNNVNIPRYADTTSTSYSWQGYSGISLNTAYNNIIPFQENAAYGVDGESMGAYSTGQYRGLVISAETCFTGSTMANGGVVTVYKTTPNIVELPAATVNTVTVTSRDVTDTNVGSTVGTITGRYTGPARTSLSIRSASAKPEYRPTWENTVATEVVPLFYSSTAVATSMGLNPGFDNSVPITMVEYSGLDSTASITIEVRSCLELVPKVGNMAAFAKPSPPASLAVWERVANFVRSLPAATVLKAASAGMAGYATGGVSGSLAAMATSFG